MESKILFFIHYMSTVKRASKNTLESYKRDLEAMKEYFYGHDIVDIEKITGTSINSYVLYLEKIGKSPATIARTISTIKTFFRCMINNGYVKREPTENINAPEQEKHKTKTISKEDIKRLLDSVEGENSIALRDRAMLELLYDSGIKVTELINLKVSDVNLDYSYVTCHGAKRDKTVPFGWTANKSVTTYMQLARESFIKDEDHGFLFMNRFGKQMTRQGFWKIFKGYASLAGVADLTTHAIHK